MRLSWISNDSKNCERRKPIDDQMDYYNNDRYQWDLLKLSPREYYAYLTTGVYPLPSYRAKG